MLVHHANDVLRRHLLYSLGDNKPIKSHGYVRAQKSNDTRERISLIPSMK